MRNLPVSVALMVTLGPAAFTAPAQAQSGGPDAIMNTIVVCSEIEDLSARLACYDGTAMQARAVLGDRSAAQAGGAAPTTANPQLAGASQPNARERFGQSSMPHEVEPVRQERERELSAITAKVESAREVQPGYFAIALDDGTAWQFTESVPRHFFPPRSGSDVTVERAALGSFRMMMAGKAPVRVRRTQ